MKRMGNSDNTRVLYRLLPEKLAEKEEKAAEEAAQTRKTGNGNGAKPDPQTGQKGQRTRGPQKLKFTYQEQKDYETIGYCSTGRKD